MKKRNLIVLILLGVLAVVSIGVHGIIPGDSDGDGVPDLDDACPAEDASYFDRDGDGCIDDPAGARHVEYWGWVDSVITYVINEDGATAITNGSDFAAIQTAMSTWPAIAGTDIAVTYGGTTPLAVAVAADNVNLVTFKDNTYAFASAVLAVGIATSFEVDSLHNGRLYRPGEVVDADMLFNPGKQFKTASQGVVGSFIEGVAMHEAGHLFALSHTAIRSSTLNYILPGGLAAASLETDDELVFLKAYPDAATKASANRIAGVVTDGYTTNPVPGAIVFAIDVASGDTTACEYTLPDGSYTFFGVPDGSYYISIYPLDGSSPIAFMQAGNVNPLVAANVQTVFVPEYYDAAESASDDATAKTGVAVSGGATATVNLITNIDAVAPTVVQTTPGNGAINVASDAAIVLRFSEGINTGTLAANFHLVRSDLTGIGGNATILSDDSLVIFVPLSPLGFDENLELTLDTGLQDKFGNGLVAPYVLVFSTEPEPPLSVSSLAPNKGIAGATVVINGNGFSV
ncbi:MAG: Ig-like domain-containing protein, partial [Candidatus Krumholzibacteria bacterium]|nr:Ig-like domain-containing protein [Candidatus Krumholzibacteria bacterium]